MVTPSPTSVVPSPFTNVSEERKVINDKQDGDAGDGKDYQAQNSTDTTAALPAEASADLPPQLGHSSSAGGGANTTSTTSMCSFGSPAYEAPAATLKDWSQSKLTKAQKKKLRYKAMKQAHMGEKSKPCPPSGATANKSVVQGHKPVADLLPCRCSVCWRSKLVN